MSKKSIQPPFKLYDFNEFLHYSSSRIGINKETIYYQGTVYQRSKKCLDLAGLLKQNDAEHKCIQSHALKYRVIRKDRKHSIFPQKTSDEIIELMMSTQTQCDFYIFSTKDIIELIKIELINKVKFYLSNNHSGKPKDFRIYLGYWSEEELKQERLNIDKLLAIECQDLKVIGQY